MAVPGLPVPANLRTNQSASSLSSRRRHASRALSTSFASWSQHPSLLRKRLVYAALFFAVFLLGRYYGSSSRRPPAFYVDPAKLPPPNEGTAGDVARLDLVPDQKIPNVVHYVFGMSKDFGGKPFGFSQFVAMNSALVTLKPQKVILWYRYLPQGWWFNKIQEYALKQGTVWENRLAREVTEI
jgi:hypothetical protein